MENLTLVGYCNICKIATIVNRLLKDRRVVHRVTTSDNEVTFEV